MFRMSVVDDEVARESREKNVEKSMKANSGNAHFARNNSLRLSIHPTPVATPHRHCRNPRFPAYPRSSPSFRRRCRRRRRRRHRRRRRRRRHRRPSPSLSSPPPSPPPPAPVVYPTFVPPPMYSWRFALQGQQTSPR